MDYSNIINTVFEYFAWLGDAIYEVRMKKKDKIFTIIDLNRVFEGKRITQSGRNAHLWLRKELSRIEEQAEYAKKTYGKVWNTPVGNDIIKHYRNLHIDSYKKDLVMKWYGKKINEWESRYKVATSMGSEDDVLYCLYKLEAYATALAKDEAIYGRMVNPWLDRIHEMYPWERENVNTDLLAIKW